MLGSILMIAYLSWLGVAGCGIGQTVSAPMGRVDTVQDTAKKRAGMVLVGLYGTVTRL